MKRIFATICLICMLLLSACGNSKNSGDAGIRANEAGSETAPVAQAENEAQHTEPADGYDELGGTWEVGGIYYKRNLVDIHDIPALEDLYDTTFLSFNEDGTFLYINLFFTSGTYIRLDDGNSFLLKTEREYRVDFKDGEAVEIESESSTKTSHIVSLKSDDENSLAFNEYDPITGKAKANDDPIIFVKSGQDSSFIGEEKISISVGGGKEDSSESAIASPAPAHIATAGEKNALSTAKSYLSFSAFSYSGLVEQLKFEGYSSSEAEYGADNCGVDWEQQALKMAKDYLDYTAFSYSGLVDQLEFEGFTHTQAQYGADNCGADWYEQAAKMAESYLEFSSFSKSQLTEQLEFEGFTSAQAEYGVGQVYRTD